jgi:hypothetical protein
MKKSKIIILCFFMMVLGISTVAAETDWSKAEGSNPKNIRRSLQQKLDLLEQQTGIPPKIRWGYRTAEDRALIVDRSYSDTTKYRTRDDGAIVRRFDGVVVVAAHGNSPHERGEAVDLLNYRAYTDAQFLAAGLSRLEEDTLTKEAHHIVER